MSRRTVVSLSVAGMLLLALASTALAGQIPRVHSQAKAASGLTRMTVVEHADTDTVVDLGPAGDSIGDSLAWANPLYNRHDSKTVGHDQGSCVRTQPGVAWECTWTNFLADGQITVEGPFNDDGSDSALAITGGTGAYSNARGEMTLHWHNAAGTKFDFIFSIRR